MTTRTLPAGYAPPHPLPFNRLMTCRGVVIGSVVTPRMPPMCSDAMRIRAALLAPMPDPIADTGHRWAPIASALAGVFVLVYLTLESLT